MRIECNHKILRGQALEDLNKNSVSSKTQGTVQNSMQQMQKDMQIVDSRIQINNAKKSRNIQIIVLHFLFFACILDCCFKAFSGA